MWTSSYLSLITHQTNTYNTRNHAPKSIDSVTIMCKECRGHWKNRIRTGLRDRCRWQVPDGHRAILVARHQITSSTTSHRTHSVHDNNDNDIAGCLTDQQVWFPGVSSRHFDENSVEFEIFETVNFNLNEKACGDRPHPMPITVSSNHHWQLQLHSWIWNQMFLLIHFEIQELWVIITTNTQTQPENFQEISRSVRHPVLIICTFPSYGKVVSSGRLYDD